MSEWWHGTPTGDLGPSTPHAIHVGTLRAATQALEARIGIPVTGKWDGTRTYGETKLAGQRTLRGRDEFLLTGHNCCDAPEEDYYPRERAERPIYAGNKPVRDEFRPNIFPVQIVGKMSNTPSTPMSDTRANATMAGQLKRGTAKRGYYYINEGEDHGSVSAVVPGPSHLIRENPVRRTVQENPAGGGLICMGRQVSFDLGRKKLDAPKRNGMLHDASGKYWSSCSLLIAPFENGDEEADGSADYFGSKDVRELCGIGHVIEIGNLRLRRGQEAP
jgi:hypothetical protein